MVEVDVVRIAKELGMWPLDGFSYVGLDGEAGMAEHLCHELAHMVQLGMELRAIDDMNVPFVADTAGHIARRLQHLPQDEQHRQEAVCFVIEKIVLARLGIEVEPDDLGNALELQVGKDFEALAIFEEGLITEEIEEWAEMVYERLRA